MKGTSVKTTKTKTVKAVKTARTVSAAKAKRTKPVKTTKAVKAAVPAKRSAQTKQKKPGVMARLVAKVRRKKQLGAAHVIAMVGILVIAGLVGAYTVVRSNADQTDKCKMHTYVKGSTGTCVKTLQSMLNSQGVASPALSVDGQFGPKTDAAVRAYQTSKGFSIDGSVGPQTWSGLCQPLGSGNTYAYEAYRADAGCISNEQVTHQSTSSDPTTQTTTTPSQSGSGATSSTPPKSSTPSTSTKSVASARCEIALGSSTKAPSLTVTNTGNTAITPNVTVGVSSNNKGISLGTKTFPTIQPGASATKSLTEYGATSTVAEGAYAATGVSPSFTCNATVLASQAATSNTGGLPAGLRTTDPPSGRIYGSGYKNYGFATRTYYPGDTIAQIGSNKLEFQKDGNLVHKKGSNPLWASGTSARRFLGKNWAEPGVRVVLQSNCNIKIYDAGGHELWASGTVSSSSKGSPQYCGLWVTDQGIRIGNYDGTTNGHTLRNLP